MAGFVVSLIALPLSLGLAIASGVPPMAGIISILCGGIIVSLLSGSHVAISGPGNGLVVVILSSVTILGGGDLYAGYLYTLAAIVIAGLITILLGFLRMGNLADFFPSATIQGMLAAIGLIIIAKQIHLMLGFGDVEASNNLMLLVKIPQSLGNMLITGGIPWAGFIGIFSLAIMFIIPKLGGRFFHAVPAPMWIVLSCIGFYYYFELFSENPFPLLPSELIQIPENISDSFVLPDFSKWNHSAFFVAVLSITLIASIESLLSIKAVDKLDPQKRRSDVNRDLKALGVGTTISGLLGGLPVVMAIARSSVNVNQGATNRFSNFAHALIVAAFVLIFSQLLNKIPLAALAAILVHTGYRLVSPAQFRKMYKWGKDQFLIFLGTLIGTLIFGLINGILIGIGLTYLIQVYMMQNPISYRRRPFIPNTLLFQEEDGKLYLSVKGQSTFMNYISLKQKLDSIPPGKHLILDFSLTTYVDNSVMEHVYHFIDEFERNGSTLEVIGLDIHDPTSPHPFAARRMLKLTSFMKKGGILSNRQEKLKEFAKEINWKFKTNSIFKAPRLENFPFFERKTIDHAYNVFSGNFEDVELKVMDVEFYEGELYARESHKLTVLTFSLPYEIPTFRLDKERIFDRIAGLAGFQDINIPGHEDFSKRFLLKGTNEEEIIEFFSNRLVLFFESHPYFHLECDGSSILIFKSQRLATISEVKALSAYGRQLITELMHQFAEVQPV